MANQYGAYPPWKLEFCNIMQQNITIATGGNNNNKDVSNVSNFWIATHDDPFPAVRTVVFRGFVGESKGKYDEPVGGNGGGKSALMVISTDREMEKYDQIVKDPHFQGCFWFKDTNHQFRLSGIAHLLGLKEEESKSFKGEDLRKYIEGIDEQWTWRNEWERLWHSHRPNRRGTFRNPTPGSILTEEKKKQLRVLEIQDNDKESEEAKQARERFVQVILEVHEAELLILSPEPGLRKKWTVSKEDGNWTEVVLCP